MTFANRRGTYSIRYTISLSSAAETVGLSRRIVQHCVALGLVRVPLGEGDLAELRRIRRLHELGVNLAGIQVILHMRRRMDRLLADMAASEVEAVNLAHRLLPFIGDEEE